jgi:hypothetical protein
MFQEALFHGVKQHRSDAINFKDSSQLKQWIELKI